MNIDNIDSRSLNRRQFLRGASLLFAAPALAGIAGCAAPSATGSKTQGPSFDGKLIVGFDQDFPPYGFVGSDGSYTGFDLDLAKAVCEMEGWSFTPSAISWDAKDGLLNSGQITCIWNGFTIEGREKDYAFTSAYMENRQVIVVRSGSGIANLAGLAGKNVITQADSAAYDLLSAGGDQEKLGATFAQLQTIGEYNTAFMMLESGSVDAVAVDYPVAVYNIGDKTATFEILSEPLNSEHFGVGFVANDTGRDLAAKVEADLKKLDASGKVKELCEKYADKGISYDLWVLPKA
ncbi:MAG: transporter substrate-binding domain-containing protein [Olsenella sp.]|nr:transporter substrate-binding domain-containing protein [Olsenella sp.]